MQHRQHTEHDYEQAYPWIKWHTPVEIVVPGVGTGLGCRFCIAQSGLRARDVQAQTHPTVGKFIDHMRHEHGREPVL